MSHLSVHLIQISEDTAETTLEKYATRQRALRLKSLQTDPASFSSKYESEKAQPMSFWLNRVKEPTARTIVMISSPNEEAAHDPSVLLREDVEWVGVNVCVKIRNATTAMAKEEQKEAGAPGEWYLAAVYVDRSVRGRGGGKRIVQFGIDLMRKEEQEQGRSGSVCLTNVLHGNDSALGLYLKLGFEITKSNAVEEKEGRTIHTTALKLQL